MKKYDTIEQAFINLYYGVVVSLPGCDPSVFFKRVDGKIFAFCKATGIFESPMNDNDIINHFNRMVKEGATLYKLEIV